MRLRVFCALSQLLFLSLSAAVKAEQLACPEIDDARPAQLINSEHNRTLISTLLEPWDSEEQSRIVFVEGYITEDGELRGPQVTRASIQKFNPRIVHRKVLRLEFAPAVVSSKPESVYIGFSIIATQIGEEFDIAIVLNKLRYVDEYGTDYVAPQRLASSFSRPQSSRDTGFDLGAHVDTDGTVLSLEYDDREGEGSRFMYQVIDAMEKACFIPGEYQGTRQQMLFVERFITHRVPY